MRRPISRKKGIERRTKLRSRPFLETLEGRIVFSTFTVNSTADTVAKPVPPGGVQTGKDAAGNISLRSAIGAANATSGSDTIEPPAGTYQFTINNLPTQINGEDADLRGDLDITGDVTINGARARIVGC